MKGPRWIVLSLLCVLPLFPPESRGESLTGCALLIGLLALLCWRVEADQGRGQALLVLLATLALPAAWAAYVPAASVAPLMLAVLAGACGLAAHALRDDDRLVRRAATALAAVAGPVAAHAVWQKLWGLRELARAVRDDPTLPDRQALLIRLEQGRPFAGFATPAALGGFLALTLPITCGLAVASRSRQRALWVGLALVQVVAFVLAASATAGAALAGALGLAALVWGRTRRLALAGAAVVAVMLLVVAVTRGERVLRLDADSPWRLRAGNLRSASAMAADHPWTGVGPGNFAEMYPQYRRRGDNEVRHAHNLPLELAAELGWPGAALACALIFGLLLRPLRGERARSPAWRRGAAVGLAAFALQNLADFTSHMPSLLWTAALLAGLLAPAGGKRARAGPASPVLAGTSLAAVAVAVAIAAAAGFAHTERLAARHAAFAGESERARRLAERAVGLAPWDVEAAMLSARLAAQHAGEAGPFATALAHADRVVALSPVRPSARELRAGVRLRSGDAPGALADLAEAARLYPLHEPYARSRDQVLRGLESRR